MLCCFMITNSEGGEFSATLFHRDSPISPFYNPHETPYQRLEKALNRSNNRLNRLHNTSLPVHSGLLVDINGDYLMNISIGTPPFPILGIMDTGSDVVWTQCRPSANKGNLFATTLSSTYKTMSCPSKECDYLRDEGAFCSRDNDNVCHYKLMYAGQSHTLGDFAFETMMLEQSSIPRSFGFFQDTLIGCSYDTYLTPQTEASGVIGLGRGPASLFTQLSPFIDWRFSYCLLRPDGDKLVSTIDFGTPVVGDGVVSTPLIDDSSHSYSLLVRLEAMSVGDVRIPFGGSFSDDQNIVIDSGATFSYLPATFFSKLSSEVTRQIVDKTIVEDPEFSDLCFKFDPASPIKTPPITMHFLGADMVLPASNAFLKVSDTVICLVFSPRDDGLSIYGNVAQQNFLIGFDLGKKTMSFKPAECGYK
ncbi:Aspartic proteinase CDR1 [Linum grandiflorum]